MLLLDEQASAPNEILTLKIEELIYEIKDRYSIVIVSHNIQQADRKSTRLNSSHIPLSRMPSSA